MGLKKQLVSLSLTFLSLGCVGFEACAQTPAKSIVVRPSGDTATSAQQELVLEGVKTSAKVAGFRVFLDPDPSTKFDTENKSYLGSLYFTHTEQGQGKEGSFTLVLPKKIAGSAKLVITPVSSDGTSLSADITVKSAKIRSVDNKDFR
jgi:hypothetical protein